MGGKKVGSSAHPITDFELPGMRPTPMGKGMRAPGTGGLRAPGRIREENEDASEKERE